MRLFILAVLPLLAAAFPALLNKADIPCGKQAKGYEPIHVDGVDRIFGGEHAKPHSWPWMAALMFDTVSTVWCGGTLIDKRWLITAGHCFYNIEDTNFKIKLGADDHGPNSSANEPSQQVVKIEKFWIHPNFSTPGPTNDITLIKLAQDVTLNDFVRPACLPKGTDRLKGGEKVVTIGWGKANYAHWPKLLQQVVLSAGNETACKEDNGGQWDPETMICAGSRNSSAAGNCFGDSGGPLLAKRDKKWVLFGIVSFGPRHCGTATTVYGYVPMFVDWVKQVMQSEGYSLEQ